RLRTEQVRAQEGRDLEVRRLLQRTPGRELRRQRRAQLLQAILRGGELGDVIGVERLDAGRRRDARLVGEQRIVGRAGLEEELRPCRPACGAGGLEVR